MCHRVSPHTSVQLHTCWEKQTNVSVPLPPFCKETKTVNLILSWKLILTQALTLMFKTGCSFWDWYSMPAMMFIKNEWAPNCELPTLTLNRLGKAEICLTGLGELRIYWKGPFSNQLFSRCFFYFKGPVQPWFKHRLKQVYLCENLKKKKAANARGAVSSLTRCIYK